MIDLLVFTLAAWGVIYVVVESVIFAPVRVAFARRGLFLQTLVYCAYCTGFWVGVALGYILALEERSPFLTSAWAGMYVMGSIALVRALAPNFLHGAFDVERELVERRDDEPDDAAG